MSDRLRESVFNILTHNWPDAIPGARVIDLFAGTGALGIEALSRGAADGVFVDDGSEARSLLRENVEALGLGGVTRILRRDATKLGPMPPQQPFGLAFLDPPYGKNLASPALAGLREGGWLAQGAICVIEEAAEATIALPDGFEILDQRRYGDTQIVICVFRSPNENPA